MGSTAAATRQWAAQLRPLHNPSVQIMTVCYRSSATTNTRLFDEPPKLCEKKVRPRCSFASRWAPSHHIGWTTTRPLCQSIGNHPSRTLSTSEDIKDDETDGERQSVRHNHDLWSHMLSELRQYQSEHGDTLVPATYPPNPTLANWVDTQRQQYRLQQEGQPSSLTKDRVDVLDGIGFVWDVHEVRWEEKLSDLEAYLERFGDCNVPTSYDPSLAAWVKTQRRQYKLLLDGKKVSHMTPERVERLDRLGFVWDSHEAIWMERLEELRMYRAYHGDCIVPMSFTSNPQLAKWVDTQRRQYKLLQSGKVSTLTPERIKLLEAEEFVWDVYEAMWRKRYEELVEFVRANGHSMVPRTYRPNPPLGNWVRSQRLYFQKRKAGKKTTLTEERIAVLDKIGFIWEPSPR